MPSLNKNTLKLLHSVSRSMTPKTPGSTGEVWRWTAVAGPEPGLQMGQTWSELTSFISQILIWHKLTLPGGGGGLINYMCGNISIFMCYESKAVMNYLDRHLKTEQLSHTCEYFPGCMYFYKTGFPILRFLQKLSPKLAMELLKILCNFEKKKSIWMKRSHNIKFLLR